LPYLATPRLISFVEILSSFIFVLRRRFNRFRVLQISSRQRLIALQEPVKLEPVNSDPDALNPAVRDLPAL
jgi:hypothetical protein